MHTMERIQRSLMLLAVATMGACLVGCGSNAMTKDDIDSLKNSPAMTDEDRQKVADGMAAGAEAARQQQEDWAKKNPEELARINAERAKMGRPPLGG